MADARELTLSLGGRWHARYGTAPCPVCQPERRRDQTALTLADGRENLVLHCKKMQCSFLDILEAAGITSGAIAAPTLFFSAPHELNRRVKLEVDARQSAKGRAEAERKAHRARLLWAEAKPITGSRAMAENG